MSKRQSSTSPSTSTPIFPIYLVPSFTILTSLPFRNRHASTASSSSIFSSNGTTASGTAMTTSSSPNSSLKESIQSPSPTCSPTSNQSLRSFKFPSLSPSGSLPTPTTPTTPTLKPLPSLHTTHPPLIRCKTCTTHLGLTTQIISKSFTGRHGRAYLISPPPPPPLPSIIPFPPPKKIERNLVNVKVGQSASRQLVTGLHVVADIECAICGSCIGWKYVDAREEEQRYKVGKFILEGARVVVERDWEDGEWGDDDFQGGDGSRFVRGEGEGEEEEGGEGDEDRARDEDEDDNDDNDDGVNNNNNSSNDDDDDDDDDSTAPEQGPKRAQKIKGNKTNSSSAFPNPNPEGRRQLHDLEIEMGRRKPPPRPDYSYPPTCNSRSNSNPDQAEDDIIVFNSSDEDECDDLFAGIWDAEVVRRRRWRKAKVSVYAGASLWRKREVEE